MEKSELTRGRARRIARETRPTVQPASESADLIWGRNAVVELLRGRRKVLRLLVASGTREQGGLASTIDLASRRGVKIQYMPREALDRLCGTSRHQGVAAQTTPYEYTDLDEILERAFATEEKPLLLVLDSIQDPQNLGSLIRTAEAMGAHGLIIPRNRAVGLTAAVGKSSAGAIEHIATAQVTNLARTIEQLKRAGIWVLGLDEDGDEDFEQIDVTVPLALVVGNEGDGMHRLVREKCDKLVRLPMRGKVNSLNAAVAGSIALYEVTRRRAAG